jgi:hypothetical protein
MCPNVNSAERNRPALCIPQRIAVNVARDRIPGRTGLVPSCRGTTCAEKPHRFFYTCTVHRSQDRRDQGGSRIA